MSGYKYVLSLQTRMRYWLVWLLIITGLGVLFSSIYFLYFPVGFQGGRNPLYNTVIIFNRSDWESIHLWFGLGMIIVLLVHIPVHWKWIMVMGNRCFGRKTCKIGRLNWRARANIIIDVVAVVSFIFAAASGIYLLFAPSGKYASTAPVLIFDYHTWDVIHTWSGVMMIAASLYHFLIHWTWVTNVSGKAFQKERI